MSDITCRRTFLAGTAAAGVAAVHAAESAIPVNFPSHPPALAREMVAVSHGNIARVKELLADRPALANAAWDWGFGDWETALGAASHTGRREIAELLLSHGAYPTLFSATMLGQLAVVKALIAARPGVERTLGPHSISLLAHAKAGGDASAEVYRYLEALGTAGGLTSEKLSEQDLTALTGDYSFGPAADDRITVSASRGQLMFTRKGADARPLVYIGDRTFHPAGAAAVRIDFSKESALTIHDGSLLVKATRL